MIGSMIHKAGAGPEPIPHKELGVENLRDAIKFAISPTAKGAARRMADQIRSEVGFCPSAFPCWWYLAVVSLTLWGTGRSAKRRGQLL